MVEATFVCAEHAYRVHHFDNDDFKAVLLVSDTEIIDAPNLVEDDDADIVPHVVPSDKVVDDDAPNPIEDDDDDDDDDDVPSNKDVNDDIKDAPARAFKVKDPESEKLRPLFGWQDTKAIKKTFKNTTQYTSMPHGTIIKKHYKSPFPALNVKR